MTWKNPFKPERRISDQMVTACCEAWEGGATIKEMAARGKMSPEAIRRIVRTNFEIEWVCGNKWTPIEYVYLRLPFGHAGVFAHPIGMCDLFEVLDSRRVQLRTRKTGEDPQKPLESVRCKRCDRTWLAGERGCDHMTERWHRQCAAVRGTDFQDPKLTDLIIPLTHEEVFYLGGEIAKLLAEAKAEWCRVQEIEQSINAVRSQQADA